MTSDSKWYEAKPDLTTPEVSKEVVEDEVLEAVKEGKIETRINHEETPSFSGPAHVEEFEKYRLTGSDLMLGTDTPSKTERPKMDVHMIRALRANDRSFNKTCSECARRVPLETIQGGKADVCDACMEK